MRDNKNIKNSEYTKMTDSLEIRKALLEVSHWCTSEYGKLVIQDAIDLINRQKAENKKLKQVIKNFKTTKERQRVEIERLQRKNSELQHETLNCKTEAIKEFVGRLKETMTITYERVDGSRGYQTEDYFIDNLVEEMTESGE